MMENGTTFEPIVSDYCELKKLDIPEKCRNCPIANYVIKTAEISANSPILSPGETTGKALDGLLQQVDNALESGYETCDGPRRGRKPETGAKALDSAIYLGTALAGLKRCTNPGFKDPVSGVPLQESSRLTHWRTIEGIWNPS